MKFTYNWLKEHLDTTAKPEEISDKLTSLGLEVDSFQNLGDIYAPFIVAEIQEAAPHPNADKLRVCKVNNGKETLQIVCGAPNARAGIKVCLAPVGANIPNGNFQIKKSKIRDVESNGMLCSAEELNLGADSEGIMELSADAVVGSKYADYANLNDSLFEIAITPNRADCLGVRGIARDLAAAGLGKLKELKFENPKAELQSPIKVDSNSYYIGRYFSGVKNDQSDECSSGKLKAIGQTPISKLVDITNYLTFDIGRPLHVYDADKLKGNIHVRAARKGEKINALNNKTYELDGELVVADDNGPVALAGVIGNVETSVDANTKNIFLEVAYFDPAEVMKTGRKHMIDSDARYRFERGLDADVMQQYAEVASYCISYLCGGKASELVISGTKPNTKREIEFDFGYIKTHGGVDVDANKAKEILTSLGFIINGNRISVPSWRADVEGRADIVEEVLRVVGLNNIPLTPIKYSTPVTNVPNPYRAALASRGLTEVVTYSFEPAEHMSPAPKLLNAISEDLNTMRGCILPNLIQAAKRNVNRGFKNIGLFEIGPTFDANGGEQIVASGIRVGKDADRNIYAQVRGVDVFDAKADLMAITGGLGEVRQESPFGAPAYYHPGRSGGIFLGKNCLGWFGELHPALAKRIDAPTPLVAFEAFIQNLPKSQKKYKKIEVSDLLSFTRDFAFVLPANVKAAELANAIRKTSPLISNVDVFDLYQGKNIEEGKKSIALTVTIQPKDKTLTDAEITSISEAIIKEASAKFSAEIRK